MGYFFNVTNISSNLNKHCLRMRSVWITTGITQSILIYRTPSIGIVFKIHKSLDQVIRMDIDIIPTPEVGARQETSVHNQLCDQAMDYEVWLTDHQYILTKLKRHRIWWGKKKSIQGNSDFNIDTWGTSLIPHATYRNTTTSHPINSLRGSSSGYLTQGFSSPLHRVASASSPCFINASV